MTYGPCTVVALGHRPCADNLVPSAGHTLAEDPLVEPGTFRAPSPYLVACIHLAAVTNINM